MDRIIDISNCLLINGCICDLYPDARAKYQQYILSESDELRWFEYDLWLLAGLEYLDEIKHQDESDLVTILKERAFLSQLRSLRRRRIHKYLGDTFPVAPERHELEADLQERVRQDLAKLESITGLPVLGAHIKNTVAYMTRAYDSVLRRQQSVIGGEASINCVVSPPETCASYPMTTLRLISELYVYNQDDQRPEGGQATFQPESCDDVLSSLECALEVSKELRLSLPDQRRYRDLGWTDRLQNGRQVFVNSYIEDYWPQGYFEEDIATELKKGIRGRSLGLPFALSILVMLLEPAKTHIPLSRVGATGELLPDGSIRRVDDLCNKIQGAINHGVELLLIPKGQDLKEVTTALETSTKLQPHDVRILEVGCVEEALDEIYGFNKESSVEGCIFLTPADTRVGSTKPNGMSPADLHIWNQISDRKDYTRNEWGTAYRIWQNTLEGSSEYSVATVTGPRYSGKSTFMLQWGHDMAASYVRVVYIEDVSAINLEQLERALASESRPMFLLAGSMRESDLIDLRDFILTLDNCVLVCEIFDWNHRAPRNPLDFLDLNLNPRSLSMQTQPVEVTRLIGNVLHLANVNGDQKLCNTQADKLMGFPFGVVVKIVDKNIDPDTFIAEEARRLKSELCAIDSNLDLYALLAYLCAFQQFSVLLPLSYIARLAIEEKRFLMGTAVDDHECHGTIVDTTMEQVISHLKLLPMVTSGIFTTSTDGCFLGMGNTYTAELILRDKASDVDGSESPLGEFLAKAQFEERTTVQLLIRNASGTCRSLIEQNSHLKERIMSLVERNRSLDKREKHELLYWGLALRDVGLSKDAIACFADQLQHYHDDNFSRLSLAYVLRDIGQLDEAAATLRVIWERREPDAVAIAAYLKILSEMGDSQEDLQTVLDGVDEITGKQELPAKAQISVQLARAAYQISRLQQGCAPDQLEAMNITSEFDSALQLAKKSSPFSLPVIYTAYAGFVRDFLRDRDQAEKMFKTALQMRRNHRPAIIDLVATHVKALIDQNISDTDRRRHCKSAISLINKHQEIFPRDEQFKINHQRAILESRRYDWSNRVSLEEFWEKGNSAVRLFESALELDKPWQSFHNSIVWRTMASFLWFLERTYYERTKHGSFPSSSSIRKASDAFRKSLALEQDSRLCSQRKVRGHLRNTALAYLQYLASFNHHAKKDEVEKLVYKAIRWGGSPGDNKKIKSLLFRLRIRVGDSERVRER